ncbi:hypothetical protein C8039_01940 [Halogeometricum sp. wsp3]|nr:hypothetical protein C8039_01940 [Halogeometricum sp. wsp3]
MLKLSSEETSARTRARRNNGTRVADPVERQRTVSLRASRVQFAPEKRPSSTASSDARRSA